MKINISRIKFRVNLDNVNESFYSNNQRFLSIKFKLSLDYSDVIICEEKLSDWVARDHNNFELLLYTIDQIQYLKV